jgi:hypothetical protein
MGAISKGITRKVEFDVTVDTAIFAAGDAMHSTVITLANCFQGSVPHARIEGVTIVDQANQKSAIDLLFFSANPSNTTVTVNAALDVADADLDDYFLGHISIAATDYASLADNAYGTKQNISLPVYPSAQGVRSLYCIVVARGTPTYAAATDLRIKLSFKQD